MSECQVEERAKAFEAYRQGALDADPSVSEQTVAVYFENWWTRRNEKRMLGSWDHYWDVP